MLSKSSQLDEDFYWQTQQDVIKQYIAAVKQLVDDKVYQAFDTRKFKLNQTEIRNYLQLLSDTFYQEFQQAKVDIPKENLLPGLSPEMQIQQLKQENRQLRSKCIQVTKQLKQQKQLLQNYQNVQQEKNVNYHDQIIQLREYIATINNKNNKQKEVVQPFIEKSSLKKTHKQYDDDKMISYSQLRSSISSTNYSTEQSTNIESTNDLQQLQNQTQNVNQLQQKILNIENDKTNKINNLNNQYTKEIAQLKKKLDIQTQQYADNMLLSKQIQLQMKNVQDKESEYKQIINNLAQEKMDLNQKIAKLKENIKQLQVKNVQYAQQLQNIKQTDNKQYDYIQDNLKQKQQIIQQQVSNLQNYLLQQSVIYYNTEQEQKELKDVQSACLLNRTYFNTTIQFVHDFLNTLFGHGGYISSIVGDNSQHYDKILAIAEYLSQQQKYIVAEFKDDINRIYNIQPSSQKLQLEKKYQPQSKLYQENTEQIQKYIADQDAKIQQLIYKQNKQSQNYQEMIQQLSETVFDKQGQSIQNENNDNGLQFTKTIVGLGIQQASQLKKNQNEIQLTNQFQTKSNQSQFKRRLFSMQNDISNDKLYETTMQ